MSRKRTYYESSERLSGVDAYMVKPFAQQQIDEADNNLYLFWVPLANHPVLKYSAEVVLSMLVMTVAEAGSERSGSKQKLVLNYLRNALKPEKVEAIMILASRMSSGLFDV